MIRWRKRWWLSLVIVVASLGYGFARWSATQPPGLHLRAGLREHADSDDGPFEVRGFSPDGSMLVAASRRRSCDAIVLWDVATGKVRKVIEPEKRKSEDDEDDEKTRPFGFSWYERKKADFLGFSPDSRMMAVGGDTEGIKIWDTTTWQVRAAIKMENTEECHFFWDEKTLLIRSDQELQTWDLSTGKQVMTLETLAGTSGGMETWISPDEKTLVVVVFDFFDGPDYEWRIDTWDTVAWRKRKNIQWKDHAAWCKKGISPEGKLLAAIDDEGFVRVWEVATGRKQCELKLRKAGIPGQEIVGCGWCPTAESYLVYYPHEGPLLLCDIERRRTTTVEEAVIGPYDGHFFSWSSDGRTLVVLGDRSVYRNQWILGLPTNFRRPAMSLFGAPINMHYCSVRRRDVRTGRVEPESWENQWYETVAFSPDGSILAVGDRRAKVHLFDVPKDRLSRH